MCSRAKRSLGAYKIPPATIIDESLILPQWDEILRFIATIKLKETTASQLFRRLNSYSKQHPLYQALTAELRSVQVAYLQRRCRRGWCSRLPV
jgi:TnpA family transposase